MDVSVSNVVGDINCDDEEDCGGVEGSGSGDGLNSFNGGGFGGGFGNGVGGDGGGTGTDGGGDFNGGGGGDDGGWGNNPRGTDSELTFAFLNCAFSPDVSICCCYSEMEKLLLQNLSSIFSTDNRL